VSHQRTCTSTALFLSVSGHKNVPSTSTLSTPSKVLFSQRSPCRSRHTRRHFQSYSRCLLVARFTFDSGGFNGTRTWPRSVVVICPFKPDDASLRPSQQTVSRWIKDNIHENLAVLDQGESKVGLLVDGFVGSKELLILGGGEVVIPADTLTHQLLLVFLSCLSHGWMTYRLECQACRHSLTSFYRGCRLGRSALGLEQTRHRLFSRNYRGGVQRQ
jgi:hypothetical protein